MNRKLLIQENPEAAPKQFPKINAKKPFLMCSTVNREALPAHRELFSQSFVQLSSLDHRRRRGSVLTSVALEGLVVGCLFLLPFLTLEVLPTERWAAFLIAPPPPPPPPAPAGPRIRISKIASEVVNGQLVAPSVIPRRVKMMKEDELPPAGSFGVVGGVEGGVPGGQVTGMLGSLLSGAHPVVAPVIATPKRIQISTGVSDGLLLQRVEPEYPIIALKAHVEGTVKLKAFISREGMIENLELVDGHPLLVRSAIAAVKQWHYRPYTLNGEPVEVETVIIVHFRMS